MKNLLLHPLAGYLLPLAVAAGLSACSDTFAPDQGGEGKMIVTTALDKEYVSSSSNQGAPLSAPGSRAAAADVSVSDISLKITSEDGSFSRTFDNAASLADPISVPVGKYNVEAFYGDINDEGFDKPHYRGSSTLSIRENATEKVAVTASLANAMVRCETSDMFRDYFASYSLSLRSTLGNEHVYTDGESRSVYLHPGQVTASITITKKNGTTATLEPKSFTAEARHSYLLRFDVNSSEAGEGQLVLTYDDLCDMEEVTVDLSDAILNAPAPRITTEGFADGDSWNIVAGDTPDRSPRATLIAQAGIDGVVLTTRSVSLLAQGWPAEVDLCNPGAAAATLQALGLRMAGMNKPGKMAVVDLTDVQSHIGYVEGGDNASVFTLQVRDKNQRVAQAPVSFTVNTVIPHLEFLSADPILVEDTDFTLYITYTGKGVDKLRLQRRNERNTWDDLTVNAVTPDATVADKYKVNATVPADVDNMQMRVVINSLAAEFDFQRVTSPYAVETINNGVFAHEALVQLNDNAPMAVKGKAPRRVAQVPGDLSWQLSTDGGTTWSTATPTAKGNARFLFSNLNPAKTYTIRALSTGVPTRRQQFTTEAEAQLPNSSMEEYYSEKGPSNNIYKWYPYAQGASNPAWNTYNPVTLSQGKSQANYNYAYDATSGTVFTSDARSGSAAAQIRTVGWGGGNTASGNLLNSWNFGTCKHVSAGQLFLGNWDGVTAEADATPNYGHTFNSRPSSFSFWYKYAVMSKSGSDNGQKGVVVFRLLDASGNAIVSYEEKLDPNCNYANVNSRPDYSVNGSYQQHTINITYPENAPKAAKVVVIFKSTDKTTSELEGLKNDSNMRPPKPMNLSDHEYLGSSLLVDDLQLNY